MTFLKISTIYTAVVGFSAAGAALSTHFLPIYGYVSFVAVCTDAMQATWSELIGFFIVFALFSVSYFLFSNKNFQNQTGSEFIVFLPCLAPTVAFPTALPIVFSLIFSVLAYFYFKNIVQKKQNTWLKSIENTILVLFLAWAYFIIDDIFVSYPPFTAMNDSPDINGNEWWISTIFTGLFVAWLFRIVVQSYFIKK